MKRSKLILLTFISFISFASVAQEKLASTEKEKAKPVKAERPFSVIEKGALLSKATFRKDTKASGNVIEIEALNTSGGSVSMGNSGGQLAKAVMPPATISDITSITGNYLSTRDVSKSGRGVVMQLVDVNFPYRGRISVSGQILEFEIKDPGFWKISLAVSE
ncbi:hypothetical protein [Daejeonella lutea]|uniref:Uncharacterized protein n=1 Tax=Daejeonella lutea TaxID=572036 RepID=A0A1T5ER91_9SPHI|nr:hypothetical protein [Daejeonella lutea]SKB86483.1 hypothetical protein SAMN05661099_3155 [Daejeonella lutea]